jgi:hypothetical protein
MTDVQQAVPVAGEAIHRLAGECSDDATKHLEIRSPLNRAIYKAVREFRLTNMCYSDDPSDAYPLVDLMSNPAPSDIGTGEMQMVDLVDGIETAVINARLTEPARKADRLGEGVAETLSIALDQNDAMRQELVHLGNLVTTLESAMAVEHAEADGSWPKLPERIERLTNAARALPDPTHTREAELRDIPDEVFREIADAKDVGTCRARVTKLLAALLAGSAQ